MLDRIAWAILRELQENARISFSELARRVNLTPPAVAERVRRLEDAGIIRGYHADLELSAVGLPVEAIVRLTTSGPAACVQFAAAAQSMPEVQQCFRVTGSESYVMRVATLSVAHLESFLNAMSVYGQAVTSVVLSTPVTQRVVEGAPVLLPATAGPSGKAEAHG